MRHLVSVACVAVFVLSVSALCPHEEESLKKFSEVYGSPPFEDSRIVITDGILLDVKSLDVHYIHIKGEGRLVFNQGQEINIVTKGISVKEDGQLIIGSESCRHKDNVNIQLKGNRQVDRSLLGPEGEKYIAVTDNGTLQIYGEDRLGWTKLSETVDRFNALSSNVHYIQSSPGRWSKRGFNVNILGSDLKPFYSELIVLPKSSARRAEKNAANLVTALIEASEGDVVTMTVYNKVRTDVDGVDMEAFYAIIEELAGIPEGELLLRQAIDSDAFSLVYVIGGAYDQALDRQLGKSVTEARAAVTYKNKKITAVSYITTDMSVESFYDLIVLNPGVGFPEIKVTHDISSWKPGDSVLLTSTDFAWRHGEVRTIKEITGTNSFTLTHELYYRHFGEIEDGVDMRGEVALLSRNVKISGLMSRGCPARNGNCDSRKTQGIDTYGGHIKVFDGFKSVEIEGAELFFMGQTMDEGNYPIHFHMCKNITGKTARVRRNSIHHTFRRAVTVHGTFGASEEAPGVQLLENVAYFVFGHAYFLEDGAEIATIVRGNLGAATQNIDNEFASDRKRATTYWITNPKTVMVGNVAAGGEGFGIWYTFPIEPLGPSEGLAYDPEEAKHTALWTFDNNVVHSHELGGLNFDFILADVDGNIAGCMEYETRVDPFSEDSMGVKVQLSRLTAYKNKVINVWLRGGWFELYKLSSADSMKGLQLARGSSQQMSVKKSVFIGISRGNEEKADYPDGVTPEDLAQVLGAVFHDGPTHFSNCWFTGFNTNGSYIAGAIGFAPKSKFHSSVVSTVTDMRFGFIDGEGGNRVFDGLVDEGVQGVGEFDGDESATFRDGDGSVTRCPSDTNWEGPVQIVKPDVNALTEKCVYRENWNMAICADKYGKIKAEPKGFFKGQDEDNFDNGGQMRRRRYNDSDEMYVEDYEKKPITEYIVVLGNQDFYYEFQYMNDFPQTARFTGTGEEKNLSVVVGVCLPDGITKDDVEIFGKTPNDIVVGSRQQNFVDTFDEVVKDTSMTKLYLNGRMLYLHLSSKKVRNPDWEKHDTDHCAGDFCPRLNVILKRKLPYTPCFKTTEDQMDSEEVLKSIPDHDCDLPASDPESDWGAGDTLGSEDGNWGQWSGWAKCCNDGDNKVSTTRFRLCDDPSPLGSGAYCVGDDLETTDCPYDCPVDGTFTDWPASYSECFCDGVANGSTGARYKERVCEGVANGGKYCKGEYFTYSACRNTCGDRNENSVDGVLSEWSEWSDCFCDGIAKGSRGAKTRTRSCDGFENMGYFCRGASNDVKPCDADCYPEQ